MSPERKRRTKWSIGPPERKREFGPKPWARVQNYRGGGRPAQLLQPAQHHHDSESRQYGTAAEGKGGGGGERRLLSLSSPPLAALTAAGEKGKAWFVPAPSSFPLLLLYFRAGFLASPFRYLFLALWSYGLMDAPQFMMIVILFLLSLVAGTSFGVIFRSRFLIRAWLDLLSESVSGLGSWEFGLVCLPMSAMLICAGVCRFRSLDCSTCPFQIGRAHV